MGRFESEILMTIKFRTQAGVGSFSELEKPLCVETIGKNGPKNGNRLKLCGWPFWPEAVVVRGLREPQLLGLEETTTIVGTITENKFA